MGNRNYLFDSLKGIAIIGVILVHSGAVDSFSGILLKISISGARGVQIFILISTILILKSLNSYSFNEQHVNFKNWYLIKFMRFIPLLYIANFYYIFQKYVSNSFFTNSLYKNIWIILSNFLFLNGLLPWTINAVNINWYIGTLAIFILIAPIIYKIINSWERSIYFTAFSITVHFFSSYIFSHFPYHFGSSQYDWRASRYNFSFLTQLPVFSFGVILYLTIYKYHIIDKIQNRLNKLNLVLLSTSLSIIVLYFLAFVIYQQMDILSYAVLFAFLILAQLIYPLKIIDNKIFGTIGKYSYGIYLFHLFLLDFSRYLLAGLKISGYFVPIFVTLVTLIISLILSYFLTNFIEKPVLTYLKNKVS